MFFSFCCLIIFLPSIWADGSNCFTVCQCTDKEINCNDQRLSRVPIATCIQRGMDKLDLSNNQITRINRGDLKNFHVKEIILSNNSISSIDGDAFTAIGNVLNILDLSRNNIIEMPHALRQLNNLTELDISGNPIPSTGYTDSIMRHLGSKLNSFHLGHKTALQRWPRSTSHLQQLHTLDINGANIPYLPPTAFSSFEKTLKNLTIRYTRLSALPLTLPKLTNLKEFHFDHNENTGDFGILVQAFVGLTNLVTLSLRDNGLTTFPFVLSPLTSLKDLSLDDNTLLYISDQAVRHINNSQIQVLRLRNCSLDRIPGAISGQKGNLPHLRELDFSANNIQSLDRNDLHSLSNLQKLSFAGSKLQYVSNGALTNLNSLNSIDFSNTLLTTVPNATLHIPNLRELNFENDDIECTCDLVDFKKHFDCSGLNTVLGSCETISSTIKNYLDIFVVNCPDYTSGCN